MERNIRIQLSKYLVCMVAVLMMVGRLTPLTIRASETSTQGVVRVGYVIYENYQEGLEGEEKSGSGYDYLQKISYYTGWNYEYVYGSFSELYQMLLEGQIDMLTDVAFSEERAKEILYSKVEAGTEEYYIYSKNVSLTESDTIELFKQNRTVGFNANSLAAEKFLQWKDMFDIECEIVEFQNQTERDKYISGDNLDLLVATNLMSTSLKKEGWIPFQRVGSAAYYFAFNREQTDLWQQLNDAQSRILAENPNFEADLLRKYQIGGSEAEVFLNVEERSYINSHDIFRVGYLEDSFPICGKDRDGNITGVIASVLSNMETRYAMEFELVSFRNSDKMLEALNTGEVDMIFPMPDDTWNAETNSLSMSNPLVTSYISVIFNGEYSEGMYKRIAVTRDSVFKVSYLSKFYPDTEFVMVDTYKDGVSLIHSHQADCMFMLTDCYNNYKRTDTDLGRMSSSSMQSSLNLCIWTRKDDTYLLSIINKALNSVGEEGLKSELIRYATVESTYTFSDFVVDNMIYIVVAVATLILLIFMISTIRVRVSTKNKNELAKAKEEAEEARKIAEDANKAKTEFLNHMSHDIRTPINGIMGLLEMIQKNREDTDKVDEYLHKIQTSSGHLLSLVNDVLDMSKLESGKTEFDQIPFDMQALVDEVNEILDTQYQNAKITHNSHFKELDHPYVYGSPIHLKQILLNLGSNALKYNKRNGSVDTYLEEIKYENNLVTVCFMIQDTGIGMTKDFVENQLFEPFTQANSEGRTKYKGTGLGMPIVKKLVTEMGGTIRVDSLIDIGSTFIVEIPFKVCSEEDAKSLRTEYADDISGMNILVVEDNELNMEIVEFMLEEENVTLTKAWNGQEALNIFKMSKMDEYDMILMDVMMPVMDGLEATRFIRSLNRTDAKTIPIIAMTANAFVEDAIKAREAGMDEHLAKPLSKDTLVTAIAKFRKN